MASLEALRHRQFLPGLPHIGGLIRGGSSVEATHGTSWHFLPDVISLLQRPSVREVNLLQATTLESRVFSAHVAREKGAVEIVTGFCDIENQVVRALDGTLPIVLLMPSSRIRLIAAHLGRRESRDTTLYEIPIGDPPLVNGHSSTLTMMEEEAVWDSALDVLKRAGVTQAVVDGEFDEIKFDPDRKVRARQISALGYSQYVRERLRLAGIQPNLPPIDAPVYP